MSKRRRPGVREPIQVYLAPEERRLLDDLSAEEGVSRAEVLRRGLKALVQARQGGRSPLLEFVRWVESESPALPADLGARHDEHLERALRGEG